MSYNATVTVEPTKSITITGDLELLQQLASECELVEQASPAGMLLIAFTQDNANKLRTILTGNNITMSGIDKKLLRYLADDGEDALFWNGDIHELANHKKEKSRKTFLDLVHYFPYRYIDRSNPQNVKHLLVNEDATVIGELVAISTIPSGRSSMVRVTLQDSLGQKITGTFFNQPWLPKTYHVGDQIIMTGKYTEYHKAGSNKFYPQINNPKIDKINTNRGEIRMVPVYYQKGGLKTWQVMNDNRSIFSRIPYIADPVPAELISKRELISREESYRLIHFPNTPEDIEKAKERIAYDELLQLQVYFEQRKQTYSHQRGAAKTDSTLSDKMISILPYKLTGAQDRAIQKIVEDMASEKPMHRILQGDVSSGKSTVAASALLVAVGSGFQAALIAPTEILATQLYDRIKEDVAMVDPKIKVEFLGGKTKNKPELYKALKYGDIDILIGTHAILQDKVVFYDLGLVVIDEQHKFGTKQRSRLREVAEGAITPDMLIMSATPIPRSLASVIYGDLDISILDELPAGRIPIETVWLTEPSEAWDKVKEEVAAGHQAYVVTSLVEDSESIDAKSAEETYLDLCRKMPNIHIGLMHGRLTAAEKAETMEAFTRGDIQVLVATTVIEVGVNVPNATVMVILNAERFGMAGLHQIRGRVGRSSLPSTCFLIGEPNSPEGEDRLNALVASNDGFYIAEKDMEIRGEGTLFGIRQSGDSDLKLANLHDHLYLLEYAKEDVHQAMLSEAFVNETNLFFEERSIDS